MQDQWESVDECAQDTKKKIQGAAARHSLLTEAHCIYVGGV